MNKYRWINCQSLSLVEQLSLENEISSAIADLYKLDCPYIIKNEVRYVRSSDKLVSDSNNIVVRLCPENKQTSIKTIYSNISDCSRQLNIGTKHIKNSLVTGKPYKGYTFSFI